jgi:hypothetical protein
MNSATAPGGSGFVHELVLYSSTEEMIEFVVPFIRHAVAADQPTLLMAHPDAASTVLDLIGPTPQLTVLPATRQPRRAASDLRATDALLAGYPPGGPQVRVINQEPPVPQSAWHEWRRREAAVNIALAHHHAWAVCAYDRHALTADMLDDLDATHPTIRRGNQHLPNPRGTRSGSSARG